jgi:hypothetical protein
MVALREVERGRDGVHRGGAGEVFDGTVDPSLEFAQTGACQIFCVTELVAQRPSIHI